METEVIQTLIPALGFPIAICIYLLWERRTVMKELNDAIRNDLCHAIKELREQIVILNERLKK